MTRPLDLTGQTFGRLTAVRRGARHSHWIFRCECGVEKEQYAAGVKRGDIQSCGCLSRDALLARCTTHGLSTHPLYTTWSGMKARCKSHPEYAGRGIKVCERWESFANFVNDVGDRPPGTTLDRRDVNGDYEPDNCRWATRREQAENTTRNVRLTHNEQSLTISQWARKLGVSAKALQRRYASGWSATEIITIPIGARR